MATLWEMKPMSTISEELGILGGEERLRADDVRLLWGYNFNSDSVKKEFFPCWSYGRPLSLLVCLSSMKWDPQAPVNCLVKNKKHIPKWCQIYLGKNAKSWYSIKSSKCNCFIHEHVWLVVNFPASASTLKFVPWYIQKLATYGGTKRTISTCCWKPSFHPKEENKSSLLDASECSWISDLEPPC